VEAFFFFLLDAVWFASLRLYLAALADGTAARGEEVWNGRRKDGGVIALGVARKRVVGEALVRHEGQYRWAAMVAVSLRYCLNRAPILPQYHFHVRDIQNVEGKSERR